VAMIMKHFTSPSRTSCLIQSHPAPLESLIVPFRGNVSLSLPRTGKPIPPVPLLSSPLQQQQQRVAHALSLFLSPSRPVRFDIDSGFAVGQQSTAHAYPPVKPVHVSSILFIQSPDPFFLHD
jgi:hypothetical protein